MTHKRPGVALALAAGLALCLALAACGRKGPLDPPPSAATPAPPPVAAAPPPLSAAPPPPGVAPTAYIDPTTPTGEAQPALPVQTTQVQPVAPPPQAAPQPQKKTFLLDPILQ